MRAPATASLAAGPAFFFSFCAPSSTCSPTARAAGTACSEMFCAACSIVPASSSTAGSACSLTCAGAAARSGLSALEQSIRAQVHAGCHGRASSSTHGQASGEALGCQRAV